MKTKIIFLFFFSMLSSSIFADSATVVVQLFPADTGRYVLADIKTTNNSLILVSGSFSDASFKVSIPWPEHTKDSMIECVLTCHLDLNGIISINIPMPVERNRDIRVIINYAAFHEEVSIKEKVKTNYYGSEHARDLDHLWNRLVDLQAQAEKISGEANPDTNGMNEIGQNMISAIGSYMSKNPGSGFWKYFIYYKLKTGADENMRRQYLSLIPPGFCAARDTGNFFDKLLCDEVNRNTTPISQLEYNLPDTENRYHHSEAQKGKILLVDYWATWCAPCLTERSELRKIYSEFKSHPDFQLISISLDSDRLKWKKYLGNNPMDWLQLIDEKRVMYDKYNILSIPENMIIDKSGKIHCRKKNIDEVRAMLSEMLKNRTGR